MQRSGLHSDMHIERETESRGRVHLISSSLDLAELYFLCISSQNPIKAMEYVNKAVQKPSKARQYLNKAMCITPVKAYMSLLKLCCKW